MSCYSIWPIHKRNRFFQNILDKIVSKTKLSFVYCNICGRVTTFCTDVPLRENGRCSFCHSQNRERQLVYIFLKLINKQNFISSLQSIKNISSISPIWICQQNSPLASYLKKIFADNCIISESFDESLKSGEIINNIMHIDMRNTLSQKSGGSPPLPQRTILAGILYKCRSGCQWAACCPPAMAQKALSTSIFSAGA